MVETVVLRYSEQELCQYVSYVPWHSWASLNQNLTALNVNNFSKFNGDKR